MSSGKGWEALLRHWHARYRVQGKALVAQQHPPVQMIGGKGAGGKFTGFFRDDGVVDFMGVLAGGRVVAFEAKESDAASWPMSKLPPHQAAFLAQVHAMGGLAFIALRLRGQAWFVPWSGLNGVASLTPANLPRLGKPIDFEEGWICHAA